MVDPVTNFAIATVALGHDDDDVSIEVGAGEGAKFPDPSTDGEFNLVWWNVADYPNPSDDPDAEIVRVTGISADTLTITRAQEGTSASAKGTNSRLALTPTKKTIDDIIEELATKLAIGGDTKGESVYVGTNDNSNFVFKTNDTDRGYFHNNGNFILYNSLLIGGNDTDNNGALICASANPATRTAYSNTLMQLAGEDEGDNVILLETANTNGQFVFRHSSGTMKTPVSTQSGNYIGNLYWFGYDDVGEEFDIGGMIAVYALNTWTDTDHSTVMRFDVTPEGSTDDIDVMRLFGHGLQIGFKDSGVKSKLLLGDDTMDAFTDVGDPSNYFQYLIRNENTNGAGVGIAFCNSTDVSNVGASIIHRRVGANSQGGLDFYTKRSTTSGEDPGLAMTLDENGDASFEEDVDVSGTVKGQIGINEQTGTSYTLVIDDRNVLVDCDNASPIALTVPDNADVAFPIGTKILVRQKGDGEVTITPDTAVTLETSLTLVTNGQHAVAGLIKVATDTWVVMGDLVAS